jgi:hypothetical protein
MNIEEINEYKELDQYIEELEIALPTCIQYLLKSTTYLQVPFLQIFKSKIEHSLSTHEEISIKILTKTMFRHGLHEMESPY